MDHSLLKKLNRRLGDLRGCNPHGQPVYKWFHSRDLTYPVKTQSGYEHWRQVEEDRWLVAKWMPPMPRSEWELQFPDLGYPAQGIYYATDLILTPGMEPNDTITDQAAGMLKINEHKTMRDHLDDIERARERNDRAQRNRISDIIDNEWTAFNHVPGRRGDHVSFGGIDATETATKQ